MDNQPPKSALLDKEMSQLTLDNLSPPSLSTYGQQAGSSTTPLNATQMIVQQSGPVQMAPPKGMIAQHISEGSDIHQTNDNANEPTRDASASRIYGGAFEHVEKCEPDAFRILQALCTSEPRTYAGIKSTLESSEVDIETKDKIEKSISSYIIQGFTYEYSAYSPGISENDVLDAADSSYRNDLRKQWHVNLAKWAEGHKKCYGSIIESRKKAFHGAISKDTYKRLNNLKNAHLSTFYAKIKQEAREELEDWLLHKMYPQFK